MPLAECGLAWDGSPRAFTPVGSGQRSSWGSNTEKHCPHSWQADQVSLLPSNTKQRKLVILLAQTLRSPRAKGTEQHTDGDTCPGWASSVLRVRKWRLLGPSHRASPALGPPRGLVRRPRAAGGKARRRCSVPSHRRTCWHSGARPAGSGGTAGWPCR